MIDAACGCCTGRICGNNEDNFYFCGELLEQENNGLDRPIQRRLSLDRERCFFVFDGMGGEEAGETASFLCAQTVRQHQDDLDNPEVPARLRLEALCRSMNKRVCQETETLDHGRMGSTAVGLLFRSDEVYACNIGDSRAFRLRDDELVQLSTDDTDLILLPGVETPRRKPRLSQHLGIFPNELTLEFHISKGKLQAGDQYLICSDGLTDMVSNIEICALLKKHRDAVGGVEALIDLAMAHGGRDNITVILCRVAKVEEAAVQSAERRRGEERDEAVADMAGLGNRTGYWLRRIWKGLRNQKDG